MPVRFAIIALAVLLAAKSAAAQTGGITPSRARYDARAELPGGGVQALGSRDIIVADTIVGGAPAWLVVNRIDAPGMGLSGADSVLMRAADLRPISRRVVMGDGRIAVDVRDSLIVGTMGSAEGSDSIRMRLGDRAFLNYYALRTALRAWPLSAGWRGTALMMELGGREDLTPLQLAVEGEEAVRVPAGEFDCWRVHVTGGGGIDERWWVSKTGGFLIRTREPIGGQGAIMQLDLVWLALAR